MVGTLVLIVVVLDGRGELCRSMGCVELNGVDVSCIVEVVFFGSVVLCSYKFIKLCSYKILYY